MSQGAFLLRGSVGTGLVQVLSIGLSFVTTVALARLMGEAGFGTYSYALTWSLLLLGPATAGIGPVLTRETAAGIETGQWGRVAGVRRFVLGLAALATALVLGAALPLVGLSMKVKGFDQGLALLVGVPVTALGAALLLARHRLLGLRRVVTAQFAESVLRPLLLLVLVGTAWGAGVPLGAAHGAAVVLGLYAAASAGTLLFVLWRIRAATPEPARTAEPESDSAWLRSAGPLLLTGIARDLNAEAGVLIMGSMLTPAEVGLYRAAQRLASLPTYVLTAINQVFQPVAASLFAKGDLEGIEVLGVRSSRVSVLLSLPFLLGFLPASLNWEFFQHAIMPSIALGLGSSAVIARLTRATLLQTIREDYIRTARSKGLHERLVIARHALKNSLIPVVTILGPLFATLVTGTFVTELIFGIPGMGKYFVSSITNRDYPVIMGTILLYAVFLVIANMIVDLVYAYLDPRIRLE